MGDRIRALSAHDGEMDREPTAAELAAIEVEWPLIEADMARLDVEIAALVHGRVVDELAWRRHRRQARRVLGAPVVRAVAA